MFCVLHLTRLSVTIDIVSVDMIWRLLDELAEGIAPNVTVNNRAKGKGVFFETL